MLGLQRYAQAATVYSPTEAALRQQKYRPTLRLCPAERSLW